MRNKFIFIPVKEHSQRVPRKNFRDFCGKPLYLHTLYKYEKEDVEIVVDTDSNEIIDTISEKKELGELLNVRVKRRKKELVGDDVSVNRLIDSFLIDYLPELSGESEKIWVAQIHVTSPFLKARTLMSAFNLMEENPSFYDSCASATSYNTRLWRFETYGWCPVNHNPMKLEKTQDLPKFYGENSCFYIFNYHDFIKSGGCRVGSSPCFFPIEFVESLDIDTEDDWNFCSKLSEIKDL